MSSPVCTPPLRIALRVAARSTRRRWSSSASPRLPAAPRGESRACHSVSSASRLPTPAIDRWSSSRAFERHGAAADPGAERLAAHHRGVRADVSEVGIDQRAAEPPLVAQGEPAAVGELEREAVPVARRGRLVDDDPPRHPEVEAQHRPVGGLGPEELPAPVRRGERVAHQRSGDLARRVRAADVGVAVVDGDDLAAQCAVHRLPRALGLGQLRHHRAYGRERASAQHAWGRPASIRSTASGASTCSITMAAAPITPARSSSAERTIRSERVPSGTARW